MTKEGCWCSSGFYMFKSIARTSFLNLNSGSSKLIQVKNLFSIAGIEEDILCSLSGKKELVWVDSGECIGGAIKCMLIKRVLFLVVVIYLYKDHVL